MSSYHKIPNTYIPWQSNEGRNASKRSKVAKRASASAHPFDSGHMMMLSVPCLQGEWENPLLVQTCYMDEFALLRTRSCSFLDISFQRWSIMSKAMSPWRAALKDGKNSHCWQYSSYSHMTVRYAKKFLLHRYKCQSAQLLVC